jgi:hypothetical protein
MSADREQEPTVFWKKHESESTRGSTRGELELIFLRKKDLDVGQ